MVVGLAREVYCQFGGDVLGRRERTERFQYKRFLPLAQI